MSRIAQLPLLGIATSDKVRLTDVDLSRTRLSTTDLRGVGAQVGEALCVIDREQGGSDALAAQNIELLSLLTAEDLRAARAADR
ncbi:hypothetical protein OHA88_04140 [Streptomyces sp. NBC_00353]|uniref:hypothetical protein n=1 Tax=Streptomyces sp. NBC_00353 TaxID=2975722 RepID=UPI002E2574BE